ncbi:MAG TPA: outer membrane beta-barrel protein, partial [Verrucomicrobiota bacterium]|nr:outer membrane beta-barrel protein [Verrucomicrobiota bacterium]
MKFNKWTLGLAALGVVSLASVVQAEERTNPVLTALSSTTISGYVDTSMIWKIGRGNYPLPGRAYDGADKQDGINLNVVGITIEKPLDETEWAAGYKVDLLFGPDAKDYGTTLDSAGNRDQFAIKQAYVALRAPLGNGLDFKIGVYDNPLRYESFESFRNPNYSRSYGYLLEPNAFTGVNISYKFTDWLTVFGGVADSPSNEINARAWKGQNWFTGDYYESENVKTYYGGITLTAPSDLGFLEGSTLTAGAYDGLPHD